MMINLFDTLFEIADSSDSLDAFLNENMQIVNDFYNSGYRDIATSRNDIDKFILLKNQCIRGMDYTKSYNKSFVLMLLDYCERFNLTAAAVRINSILHSNNISINHRQQAALLFLQKPTSNSELVGRFDDICERLQLAIDTEDDDECRAVATFLNFYGGIVNDTRLKYAEQIQAKIFLAIQNNTYDFLLNENIETATKIVLTDLPAAHSSIQEIIDRVLGKEEATPRLTDTGTDDFLIETDTAYSGELSSVPPVFDNIRSISVRHAGAEKISGRGVKIIESERELYGYFKSYGNMHKAKLQSAFDVLPDSFSSRVNVIDWGCGQGFASMLFLEKYGADRVNQITLIEPSELALRRAALHVKKYDSTIALRTVCKKLDDLEQSDFTGTPTDITAHLFSNILDIDDYSQQRLIKLVESIQSGQNYFVCVSPYIDEIKTERLESFRRYFESNYETFRLLLDITDSGRLEDTFWCCNNTYKHNSVSHGSYPNCCSPIINGCGNKWTRAIKVFEVLL